MVDSQKITLQALKLACEFIRNNPPADFPKEDFENHIAIMAGGGSRDPKGLEYVNFFLLKAMALLDE